MKRSSSHDFVGGGEEEVGGVRVFALSIRQCDIIVISIIMGGYQRQSREIYQLGVVQVNIVDSYVRRSALLSRRSLKLLEFRHKTAD